LEGVSLGSKGPSQAKARTAGISLSTLQGCVFLVRIRAQEARNQLCSKARRQSSGRSIGTKTIAEESRRQRQQRQQRAQPAASTADTTPADATPTAGTAAPPARAVTTAATVHDRAVEGISGSASTGAKQQEQIVALIQTKAKIP